MSGDVRAGSASRATRCDVGLDKDSPEGRPASIKPSELATIVAFPEVGGLQHRYEWQLAA